jgi:hypothetical protein
MIWNDHYRDVPAGAHAFLGASQHSWLNYDEDKLISVYKNRQAVILGTRLHAFAKECIDLKQKLPKSKKTLNMYVNDAIGFRMRPEQVLYYSEFSFGTADAICFNNRILRIHDLKTGVTPASLHQLEVYAALFCLEYHINPNDIETELRIYQNDDILIGKPDGGDILPVMDKIEKFNIILERLQEEESE